MIPILQFPLCWSKSSQQDFLWKLPSIQTEMISAQFFWGKCASESYEKMQKITFSNLESAPYLKSGSMPWGHSYPIFDVLKLWICFKNKHPTPSIIPMTRCSSDTNEWNQYALGEDCSWKDKIKTNKSNNLQIERSDLVLNRVKMHKSICAMFISFILFRGGGPVLTER